MLAKIVLHFLSPDASPHRRSTESNLQEQRHKLFLKFLILYRPKKDFLPGMENWRGGIVHPHKSQSSDICRKSFSNAILNVKNITLAPHSHFPSTPIHSDMRRLKWKIKHFTASRENMSEGRAGIGKVKRNILLPEKDPLRYIFSFI